LGSGGDPNLEKELRACDARCGKISIVLNSVENGLSLKRDGSPEVLRRYFSDDECYRQLFTIAIAAGDPLALCCMGPPLKTGNEGSSWMCRPSVSSLSFSLPPKVYTLNRSNFEPSQGIRDQHQKVHLCPYFQQTI
jgi:hypothetical protein